MLVRAGHTEAAVDIANLAGMNPSAVICEIMNDDGTMARMSDLEAFAQHHAVKVASISDLISYRLRNDTFVQRIEETELQSRHGGNFNMYVYANTVEYSEHIVLVKGDITDDDPVLVRVHDFNPLNDLLGDDASGEAGSRRCRVPCGKGDIFSSREIPLAQKRQRWSARSSRGL